MAQCQCGAELTGRRRKCDACKKRPGRAAAKTPAPPIEPPDSTPAGLHDRGRALWAVLGLTIDSPAGQVALEACRAADRLDELDSVIAGKGVLNLMAFRLHFDGLVEDTVDGREDVTVNLNVDVKFQAVLAEARQQQANFKTLLAEISDVVPAAPPAKKAGPAKSPLDELAERRKRK